MYIPEHRACIFLVFQKRVQESLNRCKEAWNFHQLGSEHNKSPMALFALSRQTALSRGYWTGDPGDAVEDAEDPLYGFDGEAPVPPPAEQQEDANGRAEEDPGLCGMGPDGERELEGVLNRLGDFDLDREDGNWGINVYLEAIQMLGV